MAFLLRVCAGKLKDGEEAEILKANLFGLSAQEIAEVIAPYGLKAFRGKQIAKGMYQRFLADFQDMTDLSKADRALLSEHFSIDTVIVKAEQHSKDGKTSKYLLAFVGGDCVETVLMRQPYGNSICISTQVGCVMGCLFCASTLNGLVRNLTVGEILAQVVFMQQQLAVAQQKVDTIVVMGSGEPLHNYDHLVQFLRLCHEDYVFHLGYRHITVSTAGIVPKIYALAKEQLPVTLSISLHAPTDELRSRLMPVNRRFSLTDLLAAGDAYAMETGRRVTYEYILIAGVNDGEEQARLLAKLMKGKLANVNLIPVNPVVERGLARPKAEQMERFAKVLEKRHITVTVRREMGGDIQAACGQLRHQILAGKDLK
jgi:23S rRNA (adenine2503-C2)-methyltransferase